MIGHTISHYEIKEKLGEGGMAVVYRAHDKKLDRTVALKFLPSHLTQSEEDKQRFIREAKAAAALNHPNICTVYAVEEHEDSTYAPKSGASVNKQQFIVMEYVDGMTLRDYVGAVTFGEHKTFRETPLQMEQAISFSIQIAEALAEAHDKGIVHRDIKPENIMVDSKDRIKVMDFGLAKLKGAGNLTKSGSTVGTMAYMSPEQIQGDEVDHRSDIFSFGIVLYEMLTGKTPFRGEHEAAMMYSIVNEDPLSINEFNRDVSHELAHIIYRAIDKDPEDRYQSMEEVIRELRRFKKATSKKTTVPRSEKTPEGNRPVFRDKSSKNVFIITFLTLLIAGSVYVLFFDRSPDSFTGVPNRVAVVVFENQTGDPELDPIGRMAADWLIQGLARTDIVDVVPSEISLTAYREDQSLQYNIDVISAETQANIIIAGSYYKQGDILTISPRIFDVQRNRLLRTLDPIEGNVERPMEAVGFLQQRIMGALATDFDDRLERFAGTTVQPPSYRAYEAFLRGHALFMGQRNYREAIHHYTVAFETDTMFAAPVFWKAVAHLNLGEWSISDSLTVYIEDNLYDNLIPSDRVMVEWIRAILGGNRRGAYEAARQAARIAPGSEYHYQWGYESLRMNRPREVIEAYQTLDPESHIMQGWSPYWSQLCYAYHMLKDFEGELQCARVARKQYPDIVSILWLEIRPNAAMGNYDEVEELIDLAKNMTARRIWRWESLLLDIAREFRIHGYTDEAQAVYRMLRTHFETTYTTYPEGITSLRVLGDMFYDLNELTESLAVFKILINREPEDIRWIGRLGVVLARKGEKDRALHIWEQMRDREEPYPGSAKYVWMALILANLDELDYAVDLLAEAHNRGASFTTFHRLTGLEPLENHPAFIEFMKPKG